jgi:hypothetical protein
MGILEYSRSSSRARAVRVSIKEGPPLLAALPLIQIRFKANRLRIYTEIVDIK